MIETPESLRKKPGVDLTKVDKDTVIWAETDMGVYRIEPLIHPTGAVRIESTAFPFNPTQPAVVILERSIYDDKGEVFVNYWIGVGLKMLLRGADTSVITKAVQTLSIEAQDGSWKFDLTSQ